MIFILLHILIEQFGLKIPAVFEYTSTRMILAAITSLTLCIFLGPYFIRKLYELKIGQNIRKEDCPLLGELHSKKQDTPTMGGLLILFSMVVSLFLWMNLKSIFTLILLLTTLFLGILGGRDDYLKIKYKNVKGLSARKKLFYQAVLGAFIAGSMLLPQGGLSIKSDSYFQMPVIKADQVKTDKSEPFSRTIITLQDYATRLYVPFFKDPVFYLNGKWILLAFFLIIFIIVGSSNAVNLTDGLDGLASGCLIMVASSLALFAFVSNNADLARYLHIPYVESSGEIAVYLSAFSGACLGFLWYNSHPAQVFMGDTGSLALGGVLGVSAVLLKRELLLGIVGGVFVVETLSVILQVASFKLRGKKRIFLCTPLHHHFEYKGWKETKVVIRFWIIGLLLAIIGIASLKFQ